uniref:Uncharacterized protein n=1 Tax=Sphaerodactylus townsendi TaxID=933632 RepID=A0ACB8FEK2_9SAUR
MGKCALVYSESIAVANLDLSLLQISFNEDFGSPFVLVHSTSFVKSNLHSISVLLLRVEKDELDVHGSGFHVSLEWVTISKVAKEGVQEYVVSKCQALHGKSVPHYAAIEPSSDGLMVVSYKPFAFVKPNGENEHEESEKGLEDAKKKEPLYYWQQSEDNLTVTLRLPKEFTKEGVQVRFSPDTISVALKDLPLPLLEGSLYSSIDHESSTWIIKENNRSRIT